MMVRGYLEILPGWDALNQFAVMDWTASGDSGWMAGAFKTRREAVVFAIRYARENNRELPTATVTKLNREVAV